MRLHRHRWLVTGVTCVESRNENAAFGTMDSTWVLAVCTVEGCGKTRTELAPWLVDRRAADRRGDTVSPWWSWLLTAWGVTGLVLAGRRRAIGWAVGLSAQTAWLAYALTTRQWGFIASAVIYAAVYASNWRAWRRTTTPAPPPRNIAPRRYRYGYQPLPTGKPKPVPPPGAAAAHNVPRQETR